jgi:hypothetical protein
LTSSSLRISSSLAVEVEGNVDLSTGGGRFVGLEVRGLGLTAGLTVVDMMMRIRL